MDEETVKVKKLKTGRRKKKIVKEEKDEDELKPTEKDDKVRIEEKGKGEVQTENECEDEESSKLLSSSPDESPPQDPRKKAAKMRRDIHIYAYLGDLYSLRKTMALLYDNESSPIIDINPSPETFVPIVEGAALARISNNEDVYEEMILNVDHLHKAFGVSKVHKESVMHAINELSPLDSIEESSEKLQHCMQNTSLSSICIHRHASRLLSESADGACSDSHISE